MGCLKNNNVEISVVNYRVSMSHRYDNNMVIGNVSLESENGWKTQLT